MSDSESDERLWGAIGAIGAIFFAIIGAVVGGWIAGAIWGAIWGASVGGIIVAFVGAIYHDEQRFRSGLILGAIFGAIRPALVDEWLRSLGIRDPFLDGWIGGDGGWILGAIVGAIIGVIPDRDE
jgi:hypothetical protein